MLRRRQSPPPPLSVGEKHVPSPRRRSPKRSFLGLQGWTLRGRTRSRSPPRSKESPSPETTPFPYTPEASHSVATKSERKDDSALLRELRAVLPNHVLSLNTKDHQAFVRSVVLSNMAWDYADLAKLFNMAGNRMRRWSVLLPQTSFENTKLVLDQFPHPLDPNLARIPWSSDITATASLPLAMASWDKLSAATQRKVHACVAGLSVLQGAATPRLRVNHLTLINDKVTLGVTGFEHLSQRELEHVHQECGTDITIGSDGTFYLSWNTVYDATFEIHA